MTGGAIAADTGLRGQPRVARQDFFYRAVLAKDLHGFALGGGVPVSSRRGRCWLVSGMPFTITQLPVDLVRLVVDLIDEDDSLAAALTGRWLRAAVCGDLTSRWPDGTRLGPRAVTASPARLQWALARNLIPMHSAGVCTAAAKAGRLAVLQAARAAGLPWDKGGAQGAFSQAALGGHLEVLVWAHANGSTHDGSAAYAAAGAPSRRIEMLEWLWNGPAWNESSPSTKEAHAALCCAARSGHLEVVQWLIGHGVSWVGNQSPCPGESAAEKGHLHVLKWAKLNALDLPDNLVWCAANSVQFDIIKWAITEAGFEWNGADDPWEETFDQIALSGNVEIMQWAHDHGCTMSGSAFAYAACHGSLECLKWLQQHGVPMPESAEACRVAAASGKLECLQWLRAQGFPWDAGTCRAARRATWVIPEAEATLSWAQAHGCPDDGFDGDVDSEWDERD